MTSGSVTCESASFDHQPQARARLGNVSHQERASTRVERHLLGSILARRLSSAPYSSRLAPRALREGGKKTALLPRCVPSKALQLERRTGVTRRHPSNPSTKGAGLRSVRMPRKSASSRGRMPRWWQAATARRLLGKPAAGPFPRAPRADSRAGTRVRP